MEVADMKEKEAKDQHKNNFSNSEINLNYLYDFKINLRRQDDLIAREDYRKQYII